MYYYAVVKYFNYRMDISLQVLGTFRTLEKAREQARYWAEMEYGDKYIVEGVLQNFLELDDEVTEGFTTGNGHQEYVFTVLEIDEPK